MSTDSSHMSIIQYNDLICIQDRADSLCDYDRCSIFGMFFQSLTQSTVCLEIQSGKAVVKNKYLWFLGDCSCN